MELTPERWRQISRIYHAALALDERERPAFMADACAEDEHLRRDVELLLAQPISIPTDALIPSLVREMTLPQGNSAPPLTGHRLGPYDVQELLGVGGMGEVYRARDTKLGREVAIKILPLAFMSDPNRVARFEREAHVLASLNHPHVGAIYGLEEAEGVRGLVLELVQGETLAAHLSRRAGRGLTIPEALTIARQIGDALDAAHEKGIVHRDLNPANIILQGPEASPSGGATGTSRVTAPSRVPSNINVKVLDFGLAKLSSIPELVAPLDPIDGTRRPSSSTQEGMILGTAPYLSPEQARGQPVDKRADIWAFGAVLFEMLTGRPPFTGVTISDLVAAILDREPDWQALPASTPISIRRLLSRCLSKDSRDRLRDIGDARMEIDDALGTLASATTVTLHTMTDVADRSRASRTVTIARMAGLAAAALMVFVAGWWANSRSTPPVQYQFSVAPPAGMQLVSLESAGPGSISPDGETLAFVAADSKGETAILTRRLNSVDVTRLNGTEGGSHPFWSPDSRSLAFFTPGKLLKIDLTGGIPRVLAEAKHGRGGSWSTQGVIVFTPDYTEGLYRISADGGNLARLTVPDFSKSETSHRWPFFLPDGRRFLFVVRSYRPDVHGLYLGSLDSSQVTRLGDITSSAVYAGTPGKDDGHLVFSHRGFLTAQPFSLAGGRLFGDASVIAELPTPLEDTSVASVSASDVGVLVHGGGSVSRQSFVWVDRNGKELGAITAEGQYRNPRLSPDRRNIAIEKLDFQTGLASTWLFDLERDLQYRFIFNPAIASSPVWSPDGRKMLFVSYRENRWDLMQREVADESSVSLLRTGTTVQAPTDWSKDGKWIIFQEEGPGSGDQWDIGALEIASGNVQKLVGSESNEHQGQLSPDGTWLAYTSNESGKDQIYVQRFPRTTPRHLVSAGGGDQPKWHASGRELFYVSPNQEIMSVNVDLKAEPAVLSPSRRLFQASMATPTGIFFVASYDVDSKGERFLVNAPPRAENVSQQINVVVNWHATLSAR